MPKETPTPTPAAELAAENAALKAKIAEYQAVKRQADADEIVIAAKMAKGLRREQAVAVIGRQREYDARQSQKK
jgi:hypothetical protein